MDPPVPAQEADRQDELACQRRKHWAASLRRTVPGFSGTTLAQLVAGVRAATARAGGTLDVTTFLSRQGHTRETIETVHTYLGLERRLEPTARGPSCAASDRLWSDRRLRTLEHLQTLLLED
jgi:hypothetical protein